MTVWRNMTKARRHARRGQMMPIFALSLGVFIGAMVLGIDLSRLRAEAERIQHAANAAALAGVVFLPDYQSNAYYRAREEAAKNGFHDGQSNVTVTPSIVPGYNARLQVTITEPTPLIFGGALGLGPQTISRSATAEYAQPLQMGAPDYVLGYAPFPTNLVTPTASITPTQGFYLEVRGPDGLQENGDAYSQFYESYNSGTNLHGHSETNPCSPAVGVGGCSILTQNPDVARIGEGSSGFTGYDFVVDNPTTQTLVIKIFDPYDEGAYNQDDLSSINPKPSSQTIASVYGNKFIDQWGCTAGGTNFCVTATSSNTPTVVATQFTLSGPYQSLYDNTTREIATTPSYVSTSSQPNTGTCSSDCVLADPFVAGDDPIHQLCQVLPLTSATAPTQPRLNCYDTHPDPYTYKFVNYAIIHQQGLYHIHIKTVMNPGGIYGGRYGTGGNVFGLAACAGDSNSVLGSTTSPAGDLVSGSYTAVSDPYATSGSTIGWNQNSCSNPNATITGCAHPGTAPVDQCVHIFAVGRMALYNNLAAGGSTHAYAVVPLGYVPTDYAGQTLQVRLYDVGDIPTHVSNPTVADSNNGVEVLTPAGDTTHFDDSSNSSVTNGGYAVSLPFSWGVAPTDVNSGYVSTTTSTSTTPGEIGGLGSTSHLYNGSWLNISTTIPDIGTYSPMVSTFGGYWKMLYDIGPNSYGNDTTTWEISVSGSPVHLVTDP